jgi:hypothetical protein
MSAIDLTRPRGRVYDLSTVRHPKFRMKSVHELSAVVYDLSTGRQQARKLPTVKWKTGNYWPRSELSIASDRSVPPVTPTMSLMQAENAP